MLARQELIQAGQTHLDLLAVGGFQAGLAGAWLARTSLGNGQRKERVSHAYLEQVQKLTFILPYSCPFEEARGDFFTSSEYLTNEILSLIFGCHPERSEGSLRTVA
jgi:hypothetical protein